MIRIKGSRWLWPIFAIGAFLLVLGLVLIRVEITSTAVGVVCAQTQRVLYAPRDARVAEILVVPGAQVDAGQLLMQLESPELAREQMTLRERLVEVRREIVQTESELAEIGITGGLREALSAEAVDTLHAEIQKAYEEIEQILERSVTRGGTSRLQALNVKVTASRAKQERLQNQSVLQLKASGLPEVYVERARSQLEGAHKLAGILQQHLQLIQSEMGTLQIYAPFSGTVSNVYARDPGMRVVAGEDLLTVADSSDGYEVRAFVSDRNVDLIRPGLPVRMDSHVYQSSAEGYIQGTVERIVQDPVATVPESERGFEVVIRLESYPVAPVLGQQVDVRIIAREAGPLELLFQRPLRKTLLQPSTDKEPVQ